MSFINLLCDAPFLAAGGLAVFVAAVRAFVWFVFSGDD